MKTRELIKTKMFIVELELESNKNLIAMLKKEMIEALVVTAILITLLIFNL